MMGQVLMGEKMSRFPLIWPTTAQGLFIGNINGILDYPAALQTFNIQRVLIIDDTDIGTRAAEVCTRRAFWKMLAMGDVLVENKMGYFLNNILPWIQEAREKNIPLLIVSPHGVNRAPGVAIVSLAKDSFDHAASGDWDMHFGLAVELVQHACSFAQPTPELLSSLLESIGHPLPAVYREVYQICKHLRD